MRLCMVLVVLVGCTTDRPVAPAVHVIALDGSPVLDEYTSGAAAWPLGFDVSASDSGLPECGYSWYVFGELECEITIGLRRDPLLREKRGTDALTDRSTRIVTIDADVTDSYTLQLAFAHEAGHLLLDTAEHTSGGIMGGASLSMGPQDRELACRQIHICI